jgi:hypothetical protein
MRSIVVVALATLISFAPALTAPAEAESTTLFSCSTGEKKVSVTLADGKLVYHYGSAAKDDLSIVGAPASGNVFQMAQLYAGMEYQLRFTNGDFSYIVYSMEGNASTGAHAISGLTVMQGVKVVSDQSCKRQAYVTLPPAALEIPVDTAAYSAM